MPGLKHLMMSGNVELKLQTNMFSRLSSLNYLSLSHNNQLTSLPLGVFNGLSKLYFLELANNRITELPPGIFTSTLSTLESLSLNSNRLTSISAGVFDGLQSLKSLNLGDNKLECISSDAFASLPSLWSLNVYGNSLITCYNPSWPGGSMPHPGLPTCVNETVCPGSSSSNASSPSNSSFPPPPSPASCSLTASWPSIAGTLLDPSDQPSPYITGGLGKLMTDDEEVWVCQYGHACAQGSGAGATDAYCFIYNETSETFRAWGLASELGMHRKIKPS
ncbi:hypothetical protein GUITHDRAFT_141089 [Guillardia theta CCMP2712]|uniref:Uncharacterized protein n=1 Tax=Guillardia theta (strain CCMP2712) TaxID=905079 RepID=L1J3H8_GUITC|nr:hypothetical protein GUITHDRAFT_141089 [Guillardia theta CCMP2712]EKX42689.1 hypothetical protein GUITHDRAFT_141089 [Guillardia theta CCMP2712]|eukprot:XP_005829669.1 hypothetical protein GUITHDRAFT_141089 [Guillardia theta CCMP2712]